MLNNTEKLDQTVEMIMKHLSDISKRTIANRHGKVCILFIKQLTDRMMLSEFIIKPLIEYSSSRHTLSAEELSDQVIYIDDCKTDEDFCKITEYLLNGLTVILLSWDESYLVANIKKVESKSVEDPELTYTLRGPRDSFTENLDTNLSLIRYRIKDPNLKIKMLEIGLRTKARISVSYIKDLADEKIVDEILRRIGNLEIEGLIDSGELQGLILNNKHSLFPQMGLVERSDMACSAMLRGKILIIAEGSCLALVAPKTFSEFFTSSDDLYDNKYLAAFLKIIRNIAFFSSFTLGSLYIAIVSFHNDTLPSEYVLKLAMLRSNVPFNPITGVFILEIILEILREALLRIPKQIGPAIGIAGTIIIGQAAIASGIFSPLLLIIASTSLLESFIAPDYTIMTPFRILKFIMMLLSSIFGLIGFTMGLCLILTNIISTNSFGVAFSAPVAPFNFSDFKQGFFHEKGYSPQKSLSRKTKGQ
ncbi:MAG: spore germination protein [Ruminococcaceae bacterium]|nr:spore germination protein [Oscillospiraceae bacterium]